MDLKVAILRGINVAGKRKILMADLKLMCKNLNLRDVSTYIQSGNILFTSNQKNSDLEILIEDAILKTFHFKVPVIIRSIAELQKSVHNNPFYNNQTDVSNLHLTFLKETPSSENLATLLSYNDETDVFKISNKDVFICCKGKYHQSKFSNLFFEKKLKMNTTTRNWKTVLKLLEFGNP
ncbi:DUF1697 domain-containing protein [Ochrovirga pacifica]|uniref:DUF1697 domain-containing protein n=1 Tax=Ochrovirga pacifica TaxID=1042376 RepID=UPI000255A808|nr:DUF1697 domain-containing protein [Ochrovirga pacifica]